MQKRMKLHSVALLIALIAGMQSLSSFGGFTNLVQNGDFQSGTAGWNGLVAIVGNPNAPNGIFGLGGDIYQTINTTPGRTYIISFYAAADLFFGSSLTLDLDFNGQTTAMIITPPYAYNNRTNRYDQMVWEQYSYAFMASSNVTRLEFNDRNTYDFGLAGVSMTQGPVATTTMLTNLTAGPFFPGQSLAVSYLVSPVASGAGTPTGTVTLTNELSAESGSAPAGTVTMMQTNTGTYHFGATYSGDTNFLPSSSSPVLTRTVLSMTDPAAWSPGLVVSSGTRFRQTSLMQQMLTLSNITSQTLAAVRVTVHLSAADLAAHIIVYNASGTNSAGEPYLQYNYPLPPGGNVTFTAEYYSTDRVTVPHPTFTVELVTPELLVAPPGAIQALLRPPVVLPLDNALLLDFLTVSGATYYILYKDDLSSTNWQVAQPPVAGTGYDMQWVDDGPPKTASPPGSVSQRYYQVLKAD